jgi:hypothetical protein
VKNKFKAQPVGSVTCGMFAIFNAKIFLGEESKLENFTEKMWRELPTNKYGINGKDLKSIYFDHFGVDPEYYPNLDKVTSILNSGDAVILRYEWSRVDAKGTHYALVYKDLETDQIMVANGHRMHKNDDRAALMEIPHEELIKMLTRAEISGEESQSYPWTWRISKNIVPKFEKDQNNQHRLIRKDGKVYDVDYFRIISNDEHQVFLTGLRGKSADKNFCIEEASALLALRNLDLKNYRIT